ncbi:hypothetical protein FIBSPDRAFT_503341 [Athelia psychrophila]|uniref:MYND-type domain-containing protein n=1 Tax=Athelia psychrophila TaxID=1759441 RepID=A0A166K5K0_9AGAM|nr:hypothetical protein FIBSPDRAFT_503341 [Fibularhizoctonia sp. CBS 109695]
MQLISPEGVLRYTKIDRPPDIEYCQHILRGWMIFVAPLTPSSVDDVPRLKCVRDAMEPVERVPHSVYLLLGSIASSECCGRRLSEHTIPLVNQAWPTMWVWIQYLYSVHLHPPAHGNTNAKHVAKRVATLANMYKLFRKILDMFISQIEKPMVSEIMASHPGVLSMMANMWIMEGRNKDVANGFRCGKFLQPRGASANPRSVMHERLLAQIVAACGTAEEAVSVACQRIERNLGQAQRDYELLSIDLYFFMEHLCEPSDSPLAPKMFASESARVAMTLMHTWAHIASGSCTLAASSEIRSEALHSCLVSTFLLIQRSPQAYDRIMDILRLGLVPLLIKSVWLALSPESSPIRESFPNYAIAMIEEILSPATIHRKVLSLVRRYTYDVMQKPGDLQAFEIPGVRDSWGGLLKVVDEREKVYKEFKDCGPVLLCGNVECMIKPESKRTHTHRCAACRIVFYCSKKCQRAHWHGHRGLCKSMMGNVQGIVLLCPTQIYIFSPTWLHTTWRCTTESALR